jgi:hypothetical protein
MLTNGILQEERGDVCILYQQMLLQSRHSDENERPRILVSTTLILQIFVNMVELQRHTTQSTNFGTAECKSIVFDNGIYILECMDTNM